MNKDHHQKEWINVRHGFINLKTEKQVKKYVWNKLPKNNCRLNKDDEDRTVNRNIYNFKPRDFDLKQSQCGKAVRN